MGINLSEILIKINTFHLRKCIWKYRLQNGGHFVQGEMSYRKTCNISRTLVGNKIVDNSAVVGA